MFSIFKDKLQSVQDNITTSFRVLKVSEPVSPKSPKQTFDVNAGAELLHKYQAEWEEMHKLAEENANIAKKVDDRISHLHGEVTRQWQGMTQLAAALNTVPSLCSRTDQIICQIEDVQRLVEEVEASLLHLADIVELKELQERQLDKRFQLAIHSEKQLAQLDSLRAKLSEEHRHKVLRYEKEFEKKQKERQETFGKAFEDDLETFRQTGVVPTIRPSLSTGPSLEEVELDIDTEALDHMLEE